MLLPLLMNLNMFTKPSSLEVGMVVDGGLGGGSSFYRTDWAKTGYKEKDLQESIKLDDDLVFNVLKIWAEKCQK